MVDLGWEYTGGVDAPCVEGVANRGSAGRIRRGLLRQGRHAAHCGVIATVSAEHVCDNRLYIHRVEHGPDPACATDLSSTPADTTARIRCIVFYFSIRPKEAPPHAINFRRTTG